MDPSSAFLTPILSPDDLFKSLDELLIQFEEYEVLPQLIIDHAIDLINLLIKQSYHKNDKYSINTNIGPLVIFLLQQQILSTINQIENNNNNFDFASASSLSTTTSSLTTSTTISPEQINWIITVFLTKLAPALRETIGDIDAFVHSFSQNNNNFNFTKNKNSNTTNINQFQLGLFIDTNDNINNTNDIDNDDYVNCTLYEQLMKGCNESM